MHIQIRTSCLSGRVRGWGLAFRISRGTMCWHASPAPPLALTPQSGLFGLLFGAGFVCPCCEEVTNIFSKGGGEALASETALPFLGRIPIDPRLAELQDQGSSALHSSSPAVQVGVGTSGNECPAASSPLLCASERGAVVRERERGGGHLHVD